MGGIQFVTGDLAKGEGIEAAVKVLRSLCIALALARVTRSRRDTWYGRRRVPEYSIWSTSPSSARTGSQSSAASIAPSSGTSRRSLLQKESWPIRGCPGRHCVRPSSMTASSRLSRRWPGCRWYSPPGWRFQPVDTSEVAAQLAQCALGAPAGLVPDLGGPKVYGIADWSAGTCARVASIGRSCQSTPQAALLVRSRMARTLPRTTLWVSGLGGLSRRARDRTARRRR
jgi:hypothetical protein